MLKKNLKYITKKEKKTRVKQLILKNYNVILCYGTNSEVQKKQ